MAMTRVGTLDSLRYFLLSPDFNAYVFLDETKQIHGQMDPGSRRKRYVAFAFIAFTRTPFANDKEVDLHSLLY